MASVHGNTNTSAPDHITNKISGLDAAQRRARELVDDLQHSVWIARGDWTDHLYTVTTDYEAARSEYQK